MRITVLTSCTGEKTTPSAGQLTLEDFSNVDDHVVRRTPGLHKLTRTIEEIYTARHHSRLMRGRGCAHADGPCDSSPDPLGPLWDDPRTLGSGVLRLYIFQDAKKAICAPHYRLGSEFLSPEANKNRLKVRCRIRTMQSRVVPPKALREKLALPHRATRRPCDAGPHETPLPQGHVWDPKASQRM